MRFFGEKDTQVFARDLPRTLNVQELEVTGTVLVLCFVTFCGYFRSYLEGLSS